MRSASNPLSSDAQRTYLELLDEQSRLHAALIRLATHRGLSFLGLIVIPALLIVLSVTLLITTETSPGSTVGIMILSATLLALALMGMALSPAGLSYRHRKIATRINELSIRGHEWWRSTARTFDENGCGKLQIPPGGLHLQAEVVRIKTDGTVDTVRVVRSGSEVLLRDSRNQRIVPML